MTVAILLLAAGASARMRGADKLLEPVAGQPLLRVMATRAMATGAPVVVALPPKADARRKAVEGLDVQLVTVDDASSGMGHSLRTGVASLPEAAGVLVMLADMPEITTDDLNTLLAAFAKSDAVIRATDSSGRPGHPVVFPARLFAALGALAGDQGARDLLRLEKVRLIPLPDHHATTDLDTPEDWARWRQG